MDAAGRCAASAEIGRYLTWLERERERAFAGYDELWAWSIEDLEGFWGSIWDYFQIRAHTPYERVLSSRAMPGARWFEGAELNYAEHLLGSGEEDPDASAIVAHSQTRDPIELTFGELRDQVARARAGLVRLGVRSGDRVVAYMPNIPETLVAFAAAASLGAMGQLRTRARRPQRHRSARAARPDGAAGRRRLRLS